MEAVTRRFGDLAAVDDVTLHLPQGTILGLIGPSGSGKTTLIRMLTGTLEPTQGSIVVLGQNPRKFTRHTRERLGYMPQHFVLYEELTPTENLNFVASLFGMLWPTRGRRVNRLLRLLELWDARSRRARQLSGGMQRRLELACALVHDPALMFVDEPTAGQDPILRQKIWAEFRRLREAGRTLLVSTQIVSEAAYCDRVAVLSRGRIIAIAPPDELRRIALGGDVIEIRTAAAYDALTLEDVPGVREVRQRGPREFLVVADDAATVSPRVAEAMLSAGVGVASSTEYRPTFDEVFSELVARAEPSERNAATQEGAQDRGRSVPRAA
jgi:ABC-2 type transport system ATP-binding protein